MSKKGIAIAGAAAGVAALAAVILLKKEPAAEQVEEEVKQAPLTVEEWEQLVSSEFEKIEKPVLEDGYPD